MRRVLFAMVSALSLMLAASCAVRSLPDERSAGSAARLPVHPVVLERRQPVREQVFRHAVRVEFPGTTPLSFDGIMRVTPGDAGPAIRVVCLGAFGLTLCDMTVTRDGRETHALHPLLARVPRVEEHIALCVRSVWFASLPVAAPVPLEDEPGPLREVYGSELLEHARETDGSRVVTASGPETSWTAAFVPADPQPPLVTFHNTRENYTVFIRFIAVQGGGGQQP